MKKVKCCDLGGPSICEVELCGATFEELGRACKAHVIEQNIRGDEAHLTAVKKMHDISPEDQQKMFAEYQKKFEEAPDV